MNYLMLGMSHHTAPLDLLERIALAEEACKEVTALLCSSDVISEAVCFSTCNRLEIYAAAEAFHPGIDAVCAAIHQVVGVDLTQHSQALSIKFGPDVVRHVFSVASGLESMAVGESQILGQVRQALHRGQQDETVGRVLDPLLQRALRVAKRVHHETDLSHAGPSMVQVALTEAEKHLGDLTSAPVAVLGAGAMSGLVLRSLAALGCTRVHIINRSAERAERLAVRYGAHPISLADEPLVQDTLHSAAVVVSCTGAQGYVLGPQSFDTHTPETGTQRVLIDLAMPRDIDPAVDHIDGIHRLDLASLKGLLRGHHTQESLAQAANLVAGEVQAFLAEHSQETVGPTLAALQRRADTVVTEELSRLVNRLGTNANEATVDEIRITLRRVTNKLLHTPTVRMKALAAEQEQAPDYVSAMRNLFDLEFPEDFPDRDFPEQQQILEQQQTLEQQHALGQQALLDVTKHTPREQPQP